MCKGGFRDGRPQTQVETATLKKTGVVLYRQDRTPAVDKTHAKKAEPEFNVNER